MVILSKKLRGNKAQCLACHHHCTIGENNTGLCGVRANIAGELLLKVHGKPISTNVDPIEKKPLFHFLPQSQIFSLGTLGCNFRCAFCQNWDLSQGGKGTTEQLDALINQFCQEWSPEKIVDHCLSHNITSIAYTYNEPTIFIEYAYDVMQQANAAGIKNVFVSNGYFSQKSLNLVSPYLDAINIDLKSFKDKFYQKTCGARLKHVLNNIREIHKRGIWLELTTLVIPNENDSTEELHDIANFIAQIDKDIPWHISRFFPAYKMDDAANTPMETLYQAYDIGKEHGLSYVYIGNIVDEKYESTYCSQCQTKIIKRQSYLVSLTDMFNKGKCLNCGKQNKGIWE
jgi:pyruvate formate lyase activating enzyme